MDFATFSRFKRKERKRKENERKTFVFDIVC